MTTGRPTVRPVGTLAVIRFNWPKYVAAVAIVAAAAAASGVGAPRQVATALWVAAGLGAVWAVTSLAATWWVYDHRQVYTQLTAGLAAIGEWAAVHAGFDESGPALLAAIGHPPASVTQIELRPGASLRRARRQSPRGIAGSALCPAATGPGRSSGAGPGTGGAESLDTIFVTFAAHEVRDPAGQRALFGGLRDALQPGGQLVVTEHLRNLANFAVYGPGALHFQPLATWHTRATEAGLSLESDTAITPFVHRLVWRR